MKVIFIRSHKRRIWKWVVGNVADLDTWLATELIEQGIAKEYTGQWPPRGKTKINLKDLK